MSCSEPIIVNSVVKADAYIRRWTITNDDIYLLKFKEEPPAWLEDIIKSVVNDDMGLVSDVDDLKNRFDNFEDGYTEHFYDWLDGDNRIMSQVEVIKNTGINNSAGISEIKGTLTGTIESKAWRDELVATWMNNGSGGAWFNDRVSAISNVAYAAAKSSSTLTATMKSQQDQLNSAYADIEILKKQIDGEVTTWFIDKADEQAGPVNPDGTINENAKPYWCWLPGNMCSEAEYEDQTADDTRARHTGDTYVWYEKNAYGDKQIIATYRFGKDPDTGEWNWFIFKDDISTDAYNKALAAQYTADSKIRTYYSAFPPTGTSSEPVDYGDLWIDSDDKNKLYMYMKEDQPFDINEWKEVRDTDVTASVRRLDEATVTIDGAARAKSSLLIEAEANGDSAIAGFVGESDGSTSEFKIFADKFSVAASDGQIWSDRPFTVEDSNIKFNGTVEFRNVLDDNGMPPSWLFEGDAAKDINNSITTIDGNKITTGTLHASKIQADSIWARGMIASDEFKNNITGYIPNTDQAGFMLNGKAGTGSYNYPNMYGAYIRGGYIYGTTIEGSTIKVRDLVVLTDCDKKTKMVCPMFSTGDKTWGIAPCNSTTGTYKAASYDGNNIMLFGKMHVLPSGAFTPIPYMIDLPGPLVAEYEGGANDRLPSNFLITAYIGNQERGTYYADFSEYGNIKFEPIFGIKFYVTHGGYNAYISVAASNVLKSFSGEGNLSFKAKFYTAALGWSAYYDMLPGSGILDNS